MFLVEFCSLPFATHQHLSQVLYGIPHVFKADVQRRKAKAQDVFVHSAVARAEVAYHAARNQRLHDGKRTRARRPAGRVAACQADLRATLGVLTRCGQAQGVALAALLYELYEQVSQRQRFSAQRHHATQLVGGLKAIQTATQE